MNACNNRANPYFERVTCVGTVADQSAVSSKRRHSGSTNQTCAVVKANCVRIQELEERNFPAEPMVLKKDLTPPNRVKHCVGNAEHFLLVIPGKFCDYRGGDYTCFKITYPKFGSWWLMAMSINIFDEYWENQEMRFMSKREISVLLSSSFQYCNNFVSISKSTQIKCIDL